MTGERRNFSTALEQSWKKVCWETRCAHDHLHARRTLLLVWKSRFGFGNKLHHRHFLISWLSSRRWYIWNYPMLLMLSLQHFILHLAPLEDYTRSIPPLDVLESFISSPGNSRTSKWIGFQKPDTFRWWFLHVDHSQVMAACFVLRARSKSVNFLYVITRPSGNPISTSIAIPWQLFNGTSRAQAYEA